VPLLPIACAGISITENICVKMMNLHICFQNQTNSCFFQFWKKTKQNKTWSNYNLKWPQGKCFRTFNCQTILCNLKRNSQRSYYIQKNLYLVFGTGEGWGRATHLAPTFLPSLPSATCLGQSPVCQIESEMCISRYYKWTCHRIPGKIAFSNILMVVVLE
jgi:hypothetical protein